MDWLHFDDSHLAVVVAIHERDILEQDICEVASATVLLVVV
jgi:hypothetical protein